MRIAYAFACCSILFCIFVAFFCLCICYHNLVNKDVYIRSTLVMHWIKRLGLLTVLCNKVSKDKRKTSQTLELLGH